MRNPYSDVRFIHFKSEHDAIDRLLQDLQKFKVHLPDNFNRENLLRGSGETVSYIVNDLTNRELIRQKYTFKPPARRDLIDRDEFVGDEEEEIILGSMVMGPQQKETYNVQK